MRDFHDWRDFRWKRPKMNTASHRTKGGELTERAPGGTTFSRGGFMKRSTRAAPWTPADYRAPAGAGKLSPLAISV